jgi:hypothetical protein
MDEPAGRDKSRPAAESLAGEAPERGLRDVSLASTYARGYIRFHALTDRIYGKVPA